MPVCLVGVINVFCDVGYDACVSLLVGVAAVVAGKLAGGGNKFLAAVVLRGAGAVVRGIVAAEVFSRTAAGAAFMREREDAMHNDEDRNYISVGSWMLMLLVTAIPVVGQIMILVLAFAGENESRKNYYRAILAWMLVFIAVCVFVVLAGSWPDILKRFKS